MRFQRGFCSTKHLFFAPIAVPNVRRYSHVVVYASSQRTSSDNLRKLIIMRHADTDPKPPVAIRDHDRPITEAGRVAAQQIADQLKATGWIPEILIASNAMRSRQTLDAMQTRLSELDYADIHFLGSLYTISQLDGQTKAHVEEIVAAEASAEHRCVLLLGHNKGWEETATSYAVRCQYSHHFYYQHY